MEETIKTPKPAVLSLLELARRARHAESGLALQFILVNQTHELAPYLIAALWIEDEGIVMQSGVTEVERHAPFIMWLSRLSQHLSGTQNKITHIIEFCDFKFDRFIRIFCAKSSGGHKDLRAFFAANDGIPVWIDQEGYCRFFEALQ